MAPDSDDNRDKIPELQDAGSAPTTGSVRDRTDPNDEVPVPVAMSAAEIDERAQVVEALRKQTAGKTRGDDSQQKA